MRLKAMNYFLTENGLGWRNPDGVIPRYVNKEEANKLMVDLHSGHCGRNFAAHTTGHNIIGPLFYPKCIDILYLVNCANFLLESNTFLPFPLRKSL
jgi:hypothetical protein